MFIWVFRVGGADIAQDGLPTADGSRDIAVFSLKPGCVVMVFWGVMGKSLINQRNFRFFAMTEMNIP